ncbi:MAG: PilX N-terminal domain-containing pilus assembly protein [Thermodesulfobacteriota bacterium]|nr:PilX N-terminal domain-containing pilus assembly protein [Thermodesulfobacteriota bacterium]
MKIPSLNDERGSMIVLVLVVLALLTLIGLSTISTTSIELQVSGSDSRHKRAFYTADGAIEVGSELLEQNIGCPAGFTATGVDGGGNPIADIGDITVTNLDFWIDTNAQKPSDTNRDFFFEANDGSGSHTNLTAGGNTGFSTGSALQMIAGYEGKGKGSAAGGSYIIYDLFAQNIGRKSQSIVKIHWLHVIGQEGGCNY